MATRETIIKINLENQDAIRQLGKWEAELIAVRKETTELTKEVRKSDGATAEQERQLGTLRSTAKNLSGNIRELSNDTSGLTAAGMRFRDKMSDATLEAIKQSGVLGQLAARSDHLTKEITELNASYKAGTITQQQYNAQQDKLQKELGETTTKMAGMDAKLDELNKDFQRGKITAEQFKAGVQSVNVEVSKASGAFTKGIGDLKGYALGFVGIIAVAQGLSRVFSNVTGIIADFDKAQSRLAGILGTNKQGMQALTEQAKALGATTAFTASQVADAQTELAKLGLTQNEILSSTPAILDLARGAGADISQAAEIAAGTLNAFGLGAEETTRLADVMAKSFSTTALDIDKFSFAMRVVGPVAKNAGLSIEETTALIGVLADNNIRAETSGTGLRNILGKLAQTGMTYEDAMRLIGTSTDKTKTAIDLFGLEASTVAIVLADNTVKTGELTEAFGKAGGAAKQLAADMDDNLIGDRLKLTSAWEGFVLSVDSGSGTISTALRRITSALTDILGYVTILNSTEILGDGGSGKGSVAAAEQATKNYTAELKRLIEAEAEAAGWKDKTLASTLALNKVNEDQINGMRETTRVKLAQIIQIGSAEEEAAKLRERIAAIDAQVAAGRDDRERVAAFKKTSLERAKLTILLNELEKATLDMAMADAKAAAALLTVNGQIDALKKNISDLQAKRGLLLATDIKGLAAIDAQIAADEKAIKALDGRAAALGRSTDATREAIKQIRVLTDDMRAFAAAQAAIESGQGIGRMDVVGGIGSQTPIADPADRLLPGTDIATDLRDNLGETETLTTDYANLFMTMSTSIGQSLADSFAGVEDANKKIMISILEMARNAARLYIAMAMAREIGTKGFIGIGTGLALTIAIEALMASAINSIQGFAEGGRVRQSDGPRYTRNKGDSVLISAAPGEVVMTEEQQRRANMMAGFNVFRAARVPGFASGGTVHGTALVNRQLPPRPSPSDVNSTRNTMAVTGTPIFVRVSEINSVQGTVARIAQRDTL